MTPQEVADFVTRRWRDDHAPADIMRQLLGLGVPLLKSDILKIIRAYCALNTENRREAQAPRVSKR